MQGNLHNRLAENMVGRPAPEVGAQATISMYSDRKPCTIVHVEGEIIVVQLDNVEGSDAADTRKERMMGHQDWKISRNEKGAFKVFWRQQNGRIVDFYSRAARTNKAVGSQLLVGTWDAYHDWEF